MSDALEPYPTPPRTFGRRTEMTDSNRPIWRRIAPRRADLLRPMAPAFALALLLGNANAQDSAAQIESDIAFARGLASEWSFVDLAEDVIRGVESGRMEDEQAASLALLRCEIYTVGARNERDAAKRDQLFEEALSCPQGLRREQPLRVEPHRS